MNSQPIDSETRLGSSAELSLDISRVVSQVLTGEPVDTAQKGEELAAKYRNLGMSGAMIEDAISRAAGMVGMIRGEAAPGRAEGGHAEERGVSNPPRNGGGHGPEASDEPAFAEGSRPETIEAEFGALIFGGTSESIAHVNGAERPGAKAHASQVADSGPAEPGGSGSRAKSAVAALRRAFFRG